MAIVKRGGKKDNTEKFLCGKELNTKTVLLIYGLFLLYLELLLRVFSVKVFFNIGLLYLFIFSLGGAFLCTFLTELFKGKMQKLVCVVILLIEALLYSSQIVYEYMMTTFYTPYSLGNGGQVADFYEEILAGIRGSLPGVLLVFVPALTMMFLVIRRAVFVRPSFRMNLVLLAAMFLIYGAGVGFTFVGDTGYMSTNDLVLNTDNINASVSKLGMNFTMYAQVERLIFGHGADKKFLKKIDEERTDHISLENANVINFDFDDMIKKEKNETIKRMHKYFKRSIPTYKNEKTGAFKGKNLIFVTAESLCGYAISEKYTPTLYKMQHEGYYFKNFYDPLWDVSTLDGEYTNLVGLIPKSGVWSLKEASDNWLPMTMGNQFKKKGIDTYAYHDYKAEYYRRTKTHPNLGYDIFKAMGKGLEMTKSWPPSDKEMVSKTVDEYVNNDRFHVYYLTVSGHMSYSFESNDMSNKHKDEVCKLDLPKESKAYIACNMELDKAMEVLLDELEKAGKAEDTVIVICPDHYPYALSVPARDALIGHKADEEFEIYKSCLIVYNKGMKSEQVDKYCSSLDLLPTISNLFGLKYDSRLLMGSDVFSDADPLIVLNSRNWITDKAKYNALENKVESSDDGKISQEYIDSINEKVQEKFNLSRLILENDYYAKIIPKWDGRSNCNAFE